MKKLTLFFLILAMCAGMSAFGQEKSATGNISATVKKMLGKKEKPLYKADSYEALKSNPKSGVGHSLVDVTKQDKATLFSDAQANYLKTQAKYLTFAEDNLFQWFEMPDGRYALMYKTEVKNAQGKTIKAPDATIYSVSMAENQKRCYGVNSLGIVIFWQQNLIDV